MFGINGKFFFLKMSNYIFLTPGTCVIDSEIINDIEIKISVLSICEMRMECFASG